MRYCLLVLTLFCGCGLPTMDKMMLEHQAVKAKSQATMKFQVGDLVAIKIGGLGMVVKPSAFSGDYLIRTGPAGHYKRLWFDEFELKTQETTP